MSAEPTVAVRDHRYGHAPVHDARGRSSAPQAETTTREGRVSLAIHQLCDGREPLVLVHATGLCTMVYRSLAMRLAPRFAVVGFDLPAHGETPPPADDDFSYDSFADDLAHAAAGAGLRGSPVLGHSMGGAVALIAEARHPGTFAAGYLFEPAVLTAPLDDGGAFPDMVRRRRARFDSPQELRDSLLVKPPFANCSAAAKDAMVDHLVAPDGQGVALRCLPENEARCYESRHWPAAAFCGLELPVALGCGGSDSYGAGLVPPPLAGMLPQATVTVHPDLGHFGPLEDEGRIAADVLAAL